MRKGLAAIGVRSAGAKPVTSVVSPPPCDGELIAPAVRGIGCNVPMPGRGGAEICYSWRKSRWRRRVTATWVGGGLDLPCIDGFCGVEASMDEAVSKLARQLLETGVDGLPERERRVVLHIARQSHITRDVNRTIEEQQTAGERLADQVAKFGGSWTFIILFICLLVVWVVLNTVVLANMDGGFDPYPYIFLNLILSMIAAIQAPVILMSQNRQATRDRIAAGLDYEVNLKAEVEIMALHDKLDRIRVEHLEGVLHDQATKLEELSRLVRTRLGEQPDRLPGRG